MKVMVHPFFRKNGEDRTKHQSTLDREIREILGDLAIADLNLKMALWRSEGSWDYDGPVRLPSR